MTSKLRRTIVGVGIALGGAAPGCFGRTEVATDFPPFEESDEPAAADARDARAPETTPVDAGPPSRGDAGDGSVPPDAPRGDAGPSDATPPDTGPPDAAPDFDGGAIDASDGAVDASDDAPDPFCDVTWPPTKGLPEPRTAPCVDPLNECKGNAYVPRGCFKLRAPGVCSYDRTWEGPLYCIDGEWRCPPGTEDGPRCVCFGPLSPGETCTDAGTSAP